MSHPFDAEVDCLAAKLRLEGMAPDEAVREAFHLIRSQRTREAVACGKLKWLEAAEEAGLFKVADEEAGESGEGQEGG